MLKHQWATLFITFVLMTFSLNANAATAKKIKGKSVLISLDGDTAAVEDEFFALDSSGKKKGLIRILKVQGNKAIGKITKGKVEVDWTLTYRKPKSGGGSSASADSSDSGSSSSFSRAKKYWGGMLGQNMQSMSVKLDAPDGTLKLSGSGFSLGGLFDYHVFNKIWFRGMVTYLMFNVASSKTTITCGSDCKVNITYLGLDMWGRYMLTQGKYKFWVGAGLDLLYPISGKASDVNIDEIPITTPWVLGGGADITWNSRSYIPVSLEYGLFPSSNTVSTNYIGFKVGYALVY